MQSLSKTLNRRPSAGILSRLPLFGVFAALTVLVAFSQSGCVTKRTVTRDGVVVSQETIIKRPVRDFFRDVKVE